MNRKVTIVCVCVFLAVAVSVSHADVMGPPSAGLDAGQWGVGINYLNTETDIVISSPALGSDITLEDLETDRVLGTIGYGIADWWEVYAGVGATGISFNDFDTGYVFSYGLGTKVTIIEGKQLSWGGLFQMTWLDGDDSISETIGPFTFTGTADLDWYEMRIAVGPTWQPTRSIKLYGGPMLFLMDGDIDVTINGLSTAGDLEQDSEAGAYAGAQISLIPNVALTIEGQFTSDSRGVGGGIRCKF